MNVKVGLIGVFDMLKFKNLRKNRAEMIASAEAKSKELRRVASSYVDDIMRQAEESMTAALGNIQNTHRAFSGAMPAQKAEPAPRKRAEEE